MNHIGKVRAEIAEYFDPSRLAAGSLETFVSAGGKFRLETSNYWQSKPDCNWDVTKVQLYEQASDTLLFDFIGNDGRFFHAWLKTNDAEYLVCAEDLFGGQTVIDLTQRQMHSYSPAEDGFIWVDFHLSPDGKTLATIGCYWACPYEIKLFDFSNPANLPLPELKEIALLDNDEIILGWADNVTLHTKGVKREKVAEYFEGGGMRMKTISEEPVERLINIHN